MAAASNDIKRVTLELGGKSPVVVFDDVDGKIFLSTLIGFAKLFSLCQIRWRSLIFKKENV